MLGQKGCCAPIVVALSAQVDLLSAEHAYDQLYAAFTSGAPVVIADFTSTAFCDWSSLHRLARIRHRAAACGAELRLVIPPGGAVRRAADLMELDQVLPVYPTVQEAVTAGPAPVVQVLNTPPPSRAAARSPLLADITDLIQASYLHISRWQIWFDELRKYLSAPPPGPALAATWDTLAVLIELHISADEEICAPVIYGNLPHGAAQARAARDAHEDISEMIGETSLQRPGTPQWFCLVTVTLAAWTRLCHDEKNALSAGCWRRADPAVRQRVARQWRAFREARIRDLYPGAPPQLATCQLRQAVPATPRLADPGFAPLACTCQDCTGRLDRHFLAQLVAAPTYGQV